MMFGILALSLASTSCLRQPKTQPRAFTPPPVRPVPSVSDVVPHLAQAPPVATDQAGVVPPPLPELTPGNMEIPEAPKRVTRRVAPPIAQPKPPATALPDSPASPPRLAQMFTAEEVREYTRTLDESLERVNQILSKVEAKTLTPEEKEIAERIRTFRKQAEQAREQDLLTAVSLARRADLLAKDLLGRLP